MDRIGFVSSRSGEEWLWVSGFNGDAPVRINGSQLGRVEDFDWSPNDSSIALVGAREGLRELLILPAAGGEARVLVHNNLDPQFPAWSADGSRVFFLGGTGDGRTVMQVPASGGEAKPVGLPASSYAVQASDGTLYFTRTDSTGIWTVVEGEPRLVIENVLDRVNWALAGNLIFYLARGESSMLLIMSHDLGTGEITVHDRIQSQLFPGRAFDISPAGNHVLLAVLEESESDIIMLSVTQ